MSGALGDTSPRGRLLNGMADAIVEYSFPATTVADVVRLARVSRRTFYQHFSSRGDCYAAMLAVLGEQLVADIAGSVDRSAPWQRQVRQAVEAWLEGSNARPELTLSWIRDSPGLPQARVVQIETQRRFVDLVTHLVASPVYRVDHAAPSTEIVVLLVGGLSQLIATQVESGKPLADLVDVAVTATIALLDAS